MPIYLLRSTNCIIDMISLSHCTSFPIISYFRGLRIPNSKRFQCFGANLAPSHQTCWPPVYFTLGYYLRLEMFVVYSKLSVWFMPRPIVKYAVEYWLRHNSATSSQIIIILSIWSALFGRIVPHYQRPSIQIYTTFSQQNNQQKCLSSLQ